MKPPIAAIVVLYHPNQAVITNLETYVNLVDRIILIDNTENKSDFFKNDFFLISKVQYVPLYKNTGIAKAVNTGVSLAHKLGFTWVLLMDQDSFFTNHQLQHYFSRLFSLEKLENIAVTGPEFENKNPNTSESNQIIDVNSLITSGSIMQVNAFNTLGGYDEKLFIDEVDHDYCYRAKIAGYRVIKFGDVFMEHQLGKSVPIVNLKGQQKIKSFHSATRIYYMVRNCCYTINRYKHNFPADIKIKRKDLLVRIKNHLLYGKNKGTILKHIVRGYVHFKKNRFGKL